MVSRVSSALAMWFVVSSFGFMILSALGEEHVKQHFGKERQEKIQQHRRLIGSEVATTNYFHLFKQKIEQVT